MFPARWHSTRRAGCSLFYVAAVTGATYRQLATLSKGYVLPADLQLPSARHHRPKDPATRPAGRSSAIRLIRRLLPIDPLSGETTIRFTVIKKVIMENTDMHDKCIRHTRQPLINSGRVSLSPLLSHKPTNRSQEHDVTIDDIAEKLHVQILCFKGNPRICYPVCGTVVI